MWAPYENLFTDLDTDSISRLWSSGGAASKPRGPNAAARSTTRNIRHTSGSLPKLTSSGDWPQHNIIGLPGYSKSTADKWSILSGYHWIEPIADVYPSNLYEAQIKYKTE